MKESPYVGLVMDFSLRCGEQMLSSGASAADVAVRLQALATHLGYEQTEVDVSYFAVAMSYQADHDHLPITANRVVKRRHVRYDLLVEVNRLVDGVLDDTVTVPSARGELARIVHTRPRSRWWATATAVALMGGGFGVQLGGGPFVAVVALVAAFAIDRLQYALGRLAVPLFFQQVAGGAVAALLAGLATVFPFDVNPSAAVAANIIVLLAGLGFMGALQDALQGYYMTASARITETVLLTGGIIAGVGAGLGLVHAVGIGTWELAPAYASFREVTVTLVGAALGAAAYAFSCHAPVRTLLSTALLAALAIGIVVAIPTESRLWPTGIAALAVGIGANLLRRPLQVPALVLAVPALVPLLPGLSIYRGMGFLADGTTTDASNGLLSLATAAAIALALAAGMLLGRILVQPLTRLPIPGLT